MPAGEDYALTEGLDCKHLEALCDKSLAEANRILGTAPPREFMCSPIRTRHIPTA